MGVLNWITQGCDALTSTASPTIDAMGLRICIALATIMLVWFGVQEALASTHHGAGFHVGKFLSFFMLITFAYTLVKFYDTSIPGVGQSFRGFINGGAQYLVNVIGTDSMTSIQNTLSQAQSTEGPGMMKALMNPYYAMSTSSFKFSLPSFPPWSAPSSPMAQLPALLSAYSDPIFIPFLVFEKLEFLFWGWLKAFIGFCFYKVLAAAVLSILAHLLAQYYTELVELLRSRQHGAGASAAHSAGSGQHLHPLQNSGHDHEHLLRLCWRARRRHGRTDYGRDSAGDLGTEASTMSTSNKAIPEITRAAERYLEQYGDPLVMNTYLKVTILVLAVVCLALAALVFRSQMALANVHPLIIRINDVGRAEAIDYRNFQYRPQEAENKYYLTRWAELYFSRNRFTIERDQTNSLYFLNSDVQRAVIDQERKDNTIANYTKDSSLPFVDVEVKNVILDDLRQSPYSARIEFEKVFTNPSDHTELKREQWTASVTYVFRETVKNNELAVNPLGLTIVRFRADQAFE